MSGTRVSEHSKAPLVTKVQPWGESVSSRRLASAGLAEGASIQGTNLSIYFNGCTFGLLGRWGAGDECLAHCGDAGLFLHAICRPCLIFSIPGNEITNSKTLNQNRRHYGSSIKLHCPYARGRGEKIKTITELRTCYIYIYISGIEILQQLQRKRYQAITS